MLGFEFGFRASGCKLQGLRFHRGSVVATGFLGSPISLKKRVAPFFENF